MKKPILLTILLIVCVNIGVFLGLFLERIKICSVVYCVPNGFTLPLGGG